MLVHAIVRRETNLWASEFESAGIRIIRVVGTINGVEKRDELSSPQCTFGFSFSELQRPVRCAKVPSLVERSCVCYQKGQH